jgi:two-component system response regulator TctD
MGATAEVCPREPFNPLSAPDRAMKMLLVEDHVELGRWVARALEDNRFSVERALNGADADALLAVHAYDLVILDLSLPKVDGLEVLRRLRARGSRTPVLVLTARAELDDRVRGLNLGADDYLAKPFELAELEARVKALLRRSRADASIEVSCGDLSFDTVTRAFRVGGAILPLTRREHAVLEALILRAGKAVPKEALFEQVFAMESDARVEAIEIYVHRLRKKLEGTHARITTLRGLGYLLEAVA